LKKGVLKARLVQAQYEQSEMLGKKTQNHPSAGPLFKKKMNIQSQQEKVKP
jgi:hypothetical protein